MLSPPNIVYSKILNFKNLRLSVEMDFPALLHIENKLITN